MLYFLMTLFMYLFIYLFIERCIYYITLIVFKLTAMPLVDNFVQINLTRFDTLLKCGQFIFM